MKLIYRERMMLDRYKCIDKEETFYYESFDKPKDTSLYYFRDGYNLKTVSEEDIIEISSSQERVFKLNKAPYGKSDAIRVYCKYDKIKGGYIAYAELTEINVIDNTFMFGKLFCAEYYKHNGDFYDLVVPSGRRNQKKEEEAIQITMNKARVYAEIFVKDIANSLNIPDLKLM